MRPAAIALLLCAALTALPGCGFRPLYGGGRGGETAAHLAEVAVATIPERNGQMLRNELLDRIAPYGEPAEPRWLLRVSVNEQPLSYGIQRDSTSTRASLRVNASFALVERSTGESVFGGVSQSLNSFNILRESFATMAAEQDARQRAMRDLAEDITARVAMFIGAARARDPALAPRGARP